MKPKNILNITLIFTFTFILLNIVSAQGFTVSSVSPSVSVITKDTSPSNIEWIINTQFTGGGQSLTGTIEPTTMRNFLGKDSPYPNKTITISAESVNEEVFYEIINENYPVYKYNMVSTDGEKNLGIWTKSAPPCIAPYTDWNVPLGSSFWGVTMKRYCIQKEQVGIKGAYENPIITFNAKIKVSAGGVTKEKTICSGGTSGCDSSSVDFDGLGIATWTGNLVTGDSPPNQNNFVAIKKLSSNRWSISKKSTFDSYLPNPVNTDSKLNSFVNLFPNYDNIESGEIEIYNAINPSNQAADTLLNEGASFTSGPNFNLDGNTGKVVVNLNKRLTSPNIVFRLKATWVGVVIPVGEPKILGVTSDKFGSGETGEVNIRIQNVGEAQGTFSAMLVGCEPFIQTVTSQTARITLPPNEIGTISISVSGGSLSEDFDKSCSIKVYDVNGPSIETSSGVVLSLGQAKVCTPGKVFADGNTIKKCNEKGDKAEIIERCKYGVVSDGAGGLKCASKEETCPEEQLFSKETSGCIHPLELVGYPNDTNCRSGWSGKQGSIVTINEQNYACDLFEVVHPDLLGIAQEAAQCFATNCKDTNCHGFCNEAYNKSGAAFVRNSDTFKKFAGLYIIYGLGPAAEFMRGYFQAEIECSFGSGGCEPQEGYNNNVQQLQCKGEVGQPLGWTSDTDMSGNSCIFSDLPAHVNVMVLRTGTCVDYSVSLTTLLRMVGYKNNEIFSVTGPGHEFNLVKFPSETKWNLIETTGNYGTPYNLRDVPGKWYPYCDYYLDSCANDNGQGKCPPKSEVFGC